MPNSKGQLTVHPEGSVQELWAISYPLILSFFSIHIMLFMDRFILSRYDPTAMNAAVMAGTLFAIFQYGTMGISSISDIFVGQYNGAEKYNRMGEPVWQMIWFSCMTSLLFIPIGCWAGPSWFSNPEYAKAGIPFFKILMWFGPTYPLIAALSSFFIGQGRVKLVMGTIILSNFLNIILDFILIFGIESLSPALGAEGAAYATGISQLLQAIILLREFLSRSYRETLGTSHWKLQPRLFIQMLNKGLPSFLASSLDALAWGVLAQMLASVSEIHITTYAIGDSFCFLLGCGFWGLQKGIIAVSANYIGAGRETLVSKIIASGIKIAIPILLLLAIPLFMFPSALAALFLNSEMATTWTEEMSKNIQLSMRWLWVYFLFEAMASLFSGVLTAMADTRFVMCLSSVGPWLFSVLPLSILVAQGTASPIISWVLFAVYGALNGMGFFLRYKTQVQKTFAPLHRVV